MSKCLYECLSFDDAWAGALKPWFIQQASPSFDLPQAVVLPSDSAIQFLKKQLLQSDTPLFGIQFYTPATLRHYLSRVYKCSEPSELRENLHLLMKVAAREFKDNPVAQSAALEAEQFVRLADLLEASAWSASVLKHHQVRELIEKYYESQKQHGVMTVQKVINFLQDLSQNSQPFFANLLVYGFSSRHWNYYKILLSAVRSSTEATICFLTQDNARLIDQAWLGSWEQELGPAQRLACQLESKPFSYLAYYFNEVASEEINRSRDHLPEIYIAENILREAELIVAKISQVLVFEEFTQLGIVFPNQISPLAREVARLLEHEELAHYNHLGYLGGSGHRQHLFEFWVAWQRSPRLGAFLSFLDALMNLGLFPIEQFQAFDKASRKALQSLLTDDFQLIFTYFKVNKCESTVMELLNLWTFLPEEATLHTYVLLAQTALKIIEWPKDLTLIEQRAGVLLQDLEKSIKKDDFLTWLTSVTKDLGRISNYWGQHQYAVVHLITEEEALSQSWSHLILAGVNQIEWPSQKPEVLFLGNSQIAELNHSSLTQGNQGEGHLAVKNGLSLLPSSLDQYNFSKSNFATLIGMPSTKLILTAHKKDPQNVKDSPMSEFLEKVYWISEGTVLDDKTIELILKESQAWAIDYNPRKKIPVASTQELVYAYKQRRKANEPFDEYSFGFIKPNKAALNLSCKAWEDVLTVPERAWFKHILGIESDTVLLGQPLYSLAKGTWVHSWVNLQSRGVKPSAQAWKESIECNANKVYRELEATFNAFNRSIPDIVKAHWHLSKRITHSLGSVLIDNFNDKYLFSEYNIDNTINYNSNTDLTLVDIPLKGRVDLLAYELPHLESTDNELLILDFKTGATGPLTENKIQEGTGVQLVLYALNFYKQGFNNIQFAIVPPGVSSIKKIDLSFLLEECSIFDAINSIYNSGKLGIRSSMGGYYGGNVHFPLATIKINDDIIAKKWKLTHSNLEFNN